MVRARGSIRLPASGMTKQSADRPLSVATFVVVLLYAGQCVRTEPVVLNNGGSRVCDQLKLSVSVMGMTDAVVDLGPAPQERVNLDLQYSTGKFPTVEHVDSGRPNQWGAGVPLKNLQPGKEYEVKIFAGNEQCPSLRFTTEKSGGHTCEMYSDIDFEGHDGFYGYSPDTPGKAYHTTAENADQCCNLCANIEPRLPYWNTCMHWAYEESTKKCWFKDRDAMQGKKPRDGFTAGKVIQI